jgi:ActR/RegA family two-component response regulator
MQKDIEPPNTKPRLLFVDDEAGIRVTLQTILADEGFDVTTAATVAEALELIISKKFDVLIADLNIGQAGDGFTIVSAMRRTQPSAATFILTGYPDFQTALEAIRQQVDDYFTKPADIKQMVENIKSKLQRPRHIRSVAAKRVATVIRENQDRIVQSWLVAARADKVLRLVELSDKQRMDHIPSILEALIYTLESGHSEPAAEALEAAGKHGAQRKENGYTVPMIVRESGILHNVLTSVIQECMLEIDLSTVINDVMKIGESLNALLEESMRVFHANQIGESA